MNEAHGKLTAEQLDAVAAGGVFGTEYWIIGAIGGWAEVYDGDGILVRRFDSRGEAEAWILGSAPTLGG